jgi:uroporphyrinogen III methyltransferase/synthase
MSRKGVVYLVGAGPGDEGLITVKGLRYLEEADVVLFDYLVNKRLLDRSREDAEKIYVGKRGGGTGSHQAVINKLMLAKALEGKKVVRLKGGDPIIFGRGGEEAIFLSENGIPFEIVPGVSSISAVPAYAGIPITHREFSSCFAVATGHEDSNGESLPWDALAKMPIVVFLMGVKNLERNMERLIEHGKDPETPVALISWGTLPHQRTITGTVSNIAAKAAEGNLKPPSIAVVGDVVNLREKINWFETKPLFGRRILITRASKQAWEMIMLIEQLGGEAITFPTIEVTPPERWDELDAAIEYINNYDWIIFTSANGVEYFFRRLLDSGKDARAIARAKIAAIGEKTAQALKEFGLRPDLTPREFVAECLVEEFRNLEIRGMKILIPRAQEAREVLPDELRLMGAEVNVVAVYRTLKPQRAEVEKVKQLLASGQLDTVTFTSSSTVRNFIELIGDKSLLQGTTLACIGPITASTLRELGFEPQIISRKFTAEGLISEISNYFLNH